MAADQINEEYLVQALRDKLQAEHVEVTDVSGGCGQAFTAVIVSAQFVKLNTLKRHRLVNAALRDEIARIHAWSAKCHTPDEWAQARQSTNGADAQAAAA
ncbi:bola-like protein [Niveomyces insectorum RCEF 264]|uniref:Bola-like protein n=1 Tax=Niveomyces insectorum RCEF 264 TaxID=1081102 RepID=A0A167MMN1_9HYPO|nr:bola-like protein [Niveomyces insectorum RCEF 264]